MRGDTKAEIAKKIGVLVSLSTLERGIWRATSYSEGRDLKIRPAEDCACGSI